MLINLKNLGCRQLKEQLDSLGEPSFRYTQIMKWIYQKRVDEFDQMTNIAKATRERLKEQFTLQKLPVRAVAVSKQKDAVKFGFGLHDNPTIIESVLLYDRHRRTACISSQLGCGLGCVFCETGKQGFERNLTLEEVMGQLIGINDYLEQNGDKPITNIVFMGMGEALSNWEVFRAAIDIIMAEEALNIGGRKITVSTAGVVPSIDRLIAEDLNLGLAISLNTYRNDKRTRIMPINKTYPIESLVSAARRYFEATGRRVTFEYVVIAGENDTPEAAQSLGRLLGNLACKINLIPINSSDKALVPPSSQKLESFADSLRQYGMGVTVRTSRGRDISGACGQLRARFSS